jgi:predicted O-methyltransferase YrrM
MNEVNTILFDAERVSHVEKIHSVSDEEANILYEYALKSKGNILEIGSYKGRSTIILAQALQQRGGRLFSIDPHTEPTSTYDLFIDNLKKANVDKMVFPIIKHSHEIYPTRKSYGIENVGFIFVDGNHSFSSVSLDMRWGTILKEGGFIFFHDYGDPKIQGVKQAVDRGMRMYVYSLKRVHTSKYLFGAVRL